MQEVLRVFGVGGLCGDFGDGGLEDGWWGEHGGVVFFLEIALQALDGFDGDHAVFLLFGAGLFGFSPGLSERCDIGLFRFDGLVTRGFILWSLISGRSSR
jgi:hypothetical protein